MPSYYIGGCRIKEEKKAQTGSDPISAIEDFLRETKRRLQAVKKEFPVFDEVVGMARKADIKQIDHLVKELGLNKEQRRLLHDEITGQYLTFDEIRAIAEDIVKHTLKKGRGG